MALEAAGTDTEVAFCGAKRAKTGTPFFGYIIVEPPANTDFVDFFHNQILTAWPAFLNATISARRPCAAPPSPHRHFSAMALAALRF